MDPMHASQPIKDHFSVKPFAYYTPGINTYIAAINILYNGAKSLKHKALKINAHTLLAANYLLLFHASILKQYPFNKENTYNVSDSITKTYEKGIGPFKSIVNYQFIEQANFYDTFTFIPESPLTFPLRKRVKSLNIQITDKEAYQMTLDEETDIDELKEALNVFTPVSSQILRKRYDSSASIKSEFARKDQTIFSSAEFANGIFKTDGSYLKFMRQLEEKDFDLKPMTNRLFDSEIEIEIQSLVKDLLKSHNKFMHPFGECLSSRSYFKLLVDTANILCGKFGKDLMHYGSWNLEGTYAEIFAAIHKYILTQKSKNQNQQEICWIIMSDKASKVVKEVEKTLGLKKIHIPTANHLKSFVLNIKEFDGIANIILKPNEWRPNLQQEIEDLLAFAEASGGQIVMDLTDYALDDLIKFKSRKSDLIIIDLIRAFNMRIGAANFFSVFTKKHLENYLPNPINFEESLAPNNPLYERQIPLNTAMTAFDIYMTIFFMCSKLKLADQTALMSLLEIKARNRLKNSFSKGLNIDFETDCFGLETGRIKMSPNRYFPGISNARKTIMRRLLDYSITPNFELSPKSENELIFTISWSDTDEMIENFSAALKEIYHELRFSDSPDDNPYAKGPYTLKDVPQVKDLKQFATSMAHNPFAEEFKAWPKIAQVILPDDYKESP